MRIKQIQLVLVILGLNPCLTQAADDEAKLMQENPDWHITSEAFTNPPYWLMPTNVPFRLGPLSDGKWVWTTNAPTGWYEQSTLSVTMDIAREQQLKQEWIRQHQQMSDVNDPPGIANVEEYRHRTWDQKRIWNTNETENWQGVWIEDTNTGWRVNLYAVETNKTSKVDISVVVKVGSIVTNSGAGLLPSPDGKFAKLELVDANGKAVQTKKGAALALYGMGNGIYSEGQVTNYYPPPSSDATVERNYPNTISDMDYPRWNIDVDNVIYRVRHKGMFVRAIGFASNGPPCFITAIIFNDIFDIKTEGDYMLTVQPVLYRMHYDGGTFQGYLDRVDLPCVTTKVHLVPNVK